MGRLCSTASNASLDHVPFANDDDPMSGWIYGDWKTTKSTITPTSRIAIPRLTSATWPGRRIGYENLPPSQASSHFCSRLASFDLTLRCRVNPIPYYAWANRDLGHIMVWITGEECCL